MVIYVYYLAFLVFLAKKRDLMLHGSYKEMDCQPLAIAFITFLCSIGHFVHQLFSACQLYSVLNIVKNVEQIKMTVIFLVNNASVHGYLIYHFVLVFRTLQA